jgi:hypothetical protein
MSPATARGRTPQSDANRKIDACDQLKTTEFSLS